MDRVLVVGGSSGLGLTTVVNLLKKECSRIYVIDKQAPLLDCLPDSIKSVFEKRIIFKCIDLESDELYDVLESIGEIDALIITAGFGRVAEFSNITNCELRKLISINFKAPLQIIKYYQNRIFSSSDFYCCVVSSIAGHITSPLLSVYGASKAGLSSFISSINSELEANTLKNRILDVSPGQILGTNFCGTGKCDIELNADLADQMIEMMLGRKTLFIPQYDTIYKNVINENNTNPIQFGVKSYLYKINNNRLTNKPQVKIGYLSGTFDLFHIGHLNLLKRAKEHCDYLIVGIHKSGSWKGKETFIPFDERVAIVKSIKYVDEVHESPDEDSDAWELFHYDLLFVGSDYQGSERFLKYEEFFKDKNVKIIYFPYTKGTSSTQLRERLIKEKK